MSILGLFVGCRHKQHTFHFTIRGTTRRSGVASITGTYVVCLDCGKEIPYDWNEMKLARSESQASRGGNSIPLLLDHKLR